MDINDNPKQFSWDGTMSSTGSTSFIMNYDEKNNPSDNEIKNGIAKVLNRVTKAMFEKGFASANKDFSNSFDFWKDKIDTGDIFYKKEEGRIGVSLWVQGFTNNEFEDYADKVKRVRDQITSTKPIKSSGTIECPNCHKETLTYYYNNGIHTNGSCYNCHFRCDFSI